MTTYSGNRNDQSIRARAAKNEGRFPASYWPARLRRLGLFRGVTAADIAAAPTAEWHHTGTYAAETPFYGLGDIFAARRAIRASIRARKAAPKNKFPRVLHEKARVEWVEWAGTRRHPKAVEIVHEAARVTQVSKTMVEIAVAGRVVARKALAGKHLVITEVRS